ncbi:MAG: DUF4230 domain-containing protein [Patescibacteria group bacterium]|jgi:hypothetical protein|nr:DUF4230 domain-containing protein [bacterium]HQC49591.1 DUF4230 domain-containing protein [bacterium]
MKNIKAILIFIILGLILFVAVFLYGRHLGKNANPAVSKEPVVNSQTILERITDQYFLVTKTVFINSKAEIETPKNNDWTDLFVGKKLTVRGLIRVDVGVDMKHLRLENIEVDSRHKMVTVTLPQAEILNSSLSGKLELDEDLQIINKIKTLFENTKNEDYNIALETLINDANSQVMSDPEIFTNARQDSIKLVNLIVSGMLDDYQVVIK